MVGDTFNVRVRVRVTLLVATGVTDAERLSLPVSVAVALLLGDALGLLLGVAPTLSVADEDAVSEGEGLEVTEGRAGGTQRQLTL